MYTLSDRYITSVKQSIVRYLKQASTLKRNINRNFHWVGHGKITEKYLEIKARNINQTQKPGVCLIVSPSIKIGAEFDERLIQLVQHCLRNPLRRLIVIPVLLLFEEQWHANMLFIQKGYVQGMTKYDNVRAILYEPHGTFKINFHTTSVIQRFCNILNIKYEVSLYTGLQSIECLYKERACKTVAPAKTECIGYCAAWTTLITELMMKFPYIDLEDIIQVINNEYHTNKDIVGYGKDLRTLIFNYTQNIYSTLMDAHVITDRTNVHKFIETLPNPKSVIIEKLSTSVKGAPMRRSIITQPHKRQKLL